MNSPSSSFCCYWSEGGEFIFPILLIWNVIETKQKMRVSFSMRTISIAIVTIITRYWIKEKYVINQSNNYKIFAIHPIPSIAFACPIRIAFACDLIGLSLEWSICFASSKTASPFNSSKRQTKIHASWIYIFYQANHNNLFM